MQQEFEGSSKVSRVEKYNGRPILAIDYGTKVTGLALFTPNVDPYPLPYGKIKYLDDEQLTREILQLVSLESIEIVVLGLPLYLDGNESDMTQRVKAFGQLLRQKLPAATLLFFQDETLSSFEAQERMKNSPRYNFQVNPKEIDQLAAAIILEDFLKE